MTEEPLSDGEYLVQVQAQVMVRDESSGGWLPMDRGGLSQVGLKHLKINGGGSEPRSEYSIVGKRMTDNSTVLNCSLKSDIEYFRANPKFLHWKTDDKKFGLTFESSYDAKAFDKYMSKAVSDLTFSYLNGCPTSNIDSDDAVFQLIDLPRGRTGSSSQSASTTSTTTSSPSPRSPTSVIPGLQEPFSFSPQTNHLHRVHYINTQHPRQTTTSSSPSVKSGSQKSDSFESSSGLDDPWVRGDEPTSLSGKSDQGLLELCKEDSYVYFAKNKPGAPHEYSYPSLEPTQKPPTKRESSSKRQTYVSHNNPPISLPIKMNTNKNQSRTLLGQQSRCKHCNEIFSVEENVRGSCEDGPDRVTKCIECITCVVCAHTLNYHCLSDADGEYHHPCQCDPNDSGNCKKWTAMTILSFFLPCLWCYPPLNACHRCAVSCGCCGARHKAT
ncbi:hypothetical protein SNE40_010138 [Patella caerulea]|uniref:WH1 domain-containing protein n=1 Tax=Patella caerulea TaxID=87958 RepID=A0AAN8Q477_PATCE